MVFYDRASNISKSKPNAQWKAVEKNKNINVFLVNFLNFVFLSPEELKRPRKVPNVATGYDTIIVYLKSVGLVFILNSTSLKSNN